MPGGLNGRQVADAAWAIRPELEVLFITGYRLTEPFTVDALIQRVGGMLRER